MVGLSQLCYMVGLSQLCYTIDDILLVWMVARFRIVSMLVMVIRFYSVRLVSTFLGAINAYSKKRSWIEFIEVQCTSKSRARVRWRNEVTMSSGICSQDPIAGASHENYSTTIVTYFPMIHHQICDHSNKQLTMEK